MRKQTHSPVAPFGGMLWNQFVSEVVRLWRTPGFLIPSVAVPVVLYLFFSNLNQGGLVNGVRAPVNALAAVAAYGVASVMLFSFGVSVATERGQHLNVLMRATPLPASVYALAKVLTALLSALGMLVLLCVLAGTVGGVSLSPQSWLLLIARLTLGAVPFIALGFSIGYLVNPVSAAPITNLSFLVLSFASGVLIPLKQLPDLVQQIAPYLPLYRLAQLSWNTVGVATDPLSHAIWWLIGYGLVFSVAAVLSYRAEAQRVFG
jgi:ABC-2 type transport system permease protein